MMDLHQGYANWAAPREDGQSLIWPAPADLLRATRANHEALDAATAPFQGAPLNDIRRRMRQALNHPNDQVLVATGHQTELYHPGVWVKNLLINQAARRLDGDCIHFSVDTDAPKHLQIRWPGHSVALTDDPLLTRAAWSGQLSPPTPRHLQFVRQQVQDAARHWDFQPSIEPFFDSMRHLAMQEIALAPALTNSLHKLDWDLGLRHQALVVSPLWQSPGYLVFVHHLLARADQWVSHYNAALAAFRAEQGIRRPGHPMPDLAHDPSEAEAAFWLDDLGTGERTRLKVQRDQGAWVLRSPQGQFILDPGADAWDSAQALAQFLRAAHWRISPRALTLTMFLRLFVTDLFVHGIGGGRYDQVCDKIIASFVGLTPPVFAVTTATLYFPGAQARSGVSLAELEHQAHQHRHAALGERKRELVRQIHAAPRYSAQRQQLFREMHHQLSAAWNEQAAQAWQERFAKAREDAQRDAQLFDRELFYALQPADRLHGMIEHYAQAFEG